MIDPSRAAALLFTPLPIGTAGRALPNRIWLPAMVTWRGTEDGFVTPAVHDIYMRYARGGAGHDRAGGDGHPRRGQRPAAAPQPRPLRARPARRCVAEMRAVSDSLVVPQIIDFLKIATRKPTRAFMEGMVRAAARCPEPSST